MRLPRTLRLVLLAVLLAGLPLWIAGRVRGRTASLAGAAALAKRGVAAAKSGDYATAERLLRRSLAIREQLAPGTTEHADSLNKLGVLARLRGDLRTAEEHLERGEAIQRRLAPESALRAMLLTNLGNVAQDRGDLERAERLQRQAVAILERIDPDGVGSCLQNLANVTMARGDLAGADELLRRILAIRERMGPNEAETWRVLTSLGHVAALRSDLETAQAYYQRGLTLAEKIFPEGKERAIGLSSLGEVALQRGDYATARASLRRAQEIEEKLSPDCPDAAAGLEDLARLEMESGGDLAAAEGLLRRALAIYEKVAPASVEAALVLRDLGEAASRRGRLRDALLLHRRALELQSRLAPGSTGEAAALHALGRAERRAGRHREGIRDICQAVDVLDRQRTRLGGTPEAKTSFEATLGDYYQACLEGLLASGRPAAAFHILERGRARSFLALLAERDLRLADLPPRLAAERRGVDAEYDRVQARLATLGAGRDRAEVERWTGTLRVLRDRQEEILARIRRASPRAAALQDPQPLDLAGARAALDPGTVLLEYAVGAERTWLFIVRPAGESGSGLSVARIDAGAARLRREVEDFRALVEDPGSGAELHARAARLYALLVRPAEARISGARRILLSGDGPLHTLPFAALVRGDRYLVEWRPVHSVLSATVYAQLAKARRPRSPGTGRLAAFGDPVYRGQGLEPIPGSGREVREIAALYPRARVYLGRDATEERAKALGPEARLVHFACHGLLDERFPLNSALALTSPEPPAAGRDNGLLQAWEIFEDVRLDADLVTLSACDTALGREMGGEGLVGLTRAFQYAGARSVLASLWGVPDRSTARLMKAFYTHLRAGRSKDEALRAAQIDLIREENGARGHPFHWAAFQLNGDWR